jgi:hypothetical protein
LQQHQGVKARPKELPATKYANSIQARRMQAHGIGQVPYPTMSPNFVGDIVPCDPLQLASFKFEKQSKENKTWRRRGKEEQSKTQQQDN